MNNTPTEALDLIERWSPGFWRQHPGFASVAAVAERTCDWPQWPDPDAYYAHLSAAAPVRFVGVETLRYEDHIAETGEVPTRYASWHDTLNALIWQRFPQSKTSLNRLHRAAKQQFAEEGKRGRRRDAATLFDENGAIVWTDDESLLDLIRQMDWPNLFLQHRSSFGKNLHVLLFGHGLLEKMRSPYLGLTAHALLLHLPPLGADQVTRSLLEKTDSVLDLAVAKQIDTRGEHWTPAELAPLPILGIPGWWPNNGDPVFYENRDYFRRERRRQERDR